MKKLDEILAGKKSVGLAGHVRPDGDCVGSTLGSGADDRCGKRTPACDGSSDWLDHPADEKDSEKNWHPDGQSVW